MDSSPRRRRTRLRPTGEEGPPLRLRAPGELLEAVPFLLGFHPRDSLVAVGVRGRDQRVGLTMRVDLPPIDDERTLRETAECVREAMVGDGAEACFLLAYLPDGGSCEDPTPGVLMAPRDALRLAGVRVPDVLMIADGRWRSALCRDPTCCPPEGRRYDPAGGSFVGAELAYAGLSAAPSRDDLVKALDPVDPTGRIALAEHVARCSEDVLVRLAGLGPTGTAAARDGLRVEGLRLIGAAISRYRTDEGQPVPARLDDREAARLLVTLAADVCLRDAAYERSVSGPPARRVAARACWTDLVRRAPEGFVAPVATILGLLAWDQGDGLTAQLAVDRALADDDGYRMALLLQTMISHRLRDANGPALRAIRRQIAGWGRLATEWRGMVSRTG